MAKVKIGGGSVFERTEKKYILTQVQYEKLGEYLNTTMEKDEHGLHTIHTIYYDSDDFAIIRHSLDKPVFKEKLRLRSYGNAKASSTVYLELKKKLNGITYKRRVAMTLQQAEQYLQHGINPFPNNQIMGEIDWFSSQQQPIFAKMLLSYDRIALFGKEDPDLRITFDQNIRWRDYNVSLSQGDYGQNLLPMGTRLMEIKILGSLPLELSQKLSELGIFSVSFSKCGTVYRDFSQYKEEISNVG